MTLTDEQLAEIKARLRNRSPAFSSGWTEEDSIFWHNSPTDIRALLDEVERLRKFEADALPVLDAYEHMHTRAVRAEAEIERMKAELERSKENSRWLVGELEIAVDVDRD